MRVIRASQEVWKFLMSESIATGEPVSIVLDRMMAEAMKNAKRGGIEGRNKKRNNGGSDEGYLGIRGLTK